MKQLIYILFPFSQKLCLYRWVVQVVGVNPYDCCCCGVVCGLGVVGVVDVACLDVDRGYGLGCLCLGYTYA